MRDLPLTPEQAEDVRRQIAWHRKDANFEAADRWAQRLSAAVPECSVCGARRLPSVRWCAAHAPVFIREPLRRPPARTVIDRAREAVIAHPDWDDAALQKLAGCGAGAIAQARAALQLHRDRWWELRQLRERREAADA